MAQRIGQVMVHVRFDGRSWTVPASALNISAASSDDEIQQAVAAYLDVVVIELAPYVVERHTSGNITVRPEAIFG
jgi:hypothetical protein